MLNCIEVIRRLGIRWALWRTQYALRQRCGLLKRRFPAVDASGLAFGSVLQRDIPSQPEEYRAFRETQSVGFFIESGSLPSQELLSRLMSREQIDRTIGIADDYCRGRFLYYSCHRHELRWPVNWILNPFTGGEHNASKHWCDTQAFSSELGDIKDVWEPSRFACAFWLVRAYALTADEKYAEAFWNLFESWCEQNPPNMGPNWKCGQETAFRTMAWCFALFGFWNASATTPERVVEMTKMIAIQADRIVKNIGYAISQKNNHGLSEAVGLLTVGLLFPELRGASHWEAVGRRTLERETARQIYDDGSFVQHSMNYHRVMLHDCVWAIRLADLNGKPLSEGLKERVAKAGEFLFEMLDIESGGVPNYGANDGALVLPLSSCDYPDFRATVQAARFQATGSRVLDSGPWDEMLLWLFGEKALAGPRSDASPSSRRFDAGGYYTIRGKDTWCMVRCHTYRDRPAHVDMLHLDLWHKGVNVLGDSGTYRYYVPGDQMVERFFKDIGAHNTVEIDGAGPLKLASRFLWVPWPEGRCLLHASNRWQGEHNAYDQSPWHVVHRRCVELEDDAMWCVTDELTGAGVHDIRLRWHLADGAVQVDAEALTVRLDYECGCTEVSIDAPADTHICVHRDLGNTTRATGWVSDYYGECKPRPTLEVAGRYSLPVALVTRIRMGDHS